MNSSKQVISQERVRRAPPQFSWVGQRLVRDKHIDHLDVHAGAHYLFPITVAGARCLSRYGGASTAQCLSVDEHRRLDLIRAGLLAYADGLYQVLALGAPLPSTPCHDVASCIVQPVPFTPEVRHTVVAHEHLKALHAALGRRT